MREMPQKPDEPNSYGEEARKNKARRRVTDTQPTHRQPKHSTQLWQLKPLCAAGSHSSTCSPGCTLRSMPTRCSRLRCCWRRRTRRRPSELRTCRGRSFTASRTDASPPWACLQFSSPMRVLYFSRVRRARCATLHVSAMLTDVQTSRTGVVCYPMCNARSCRVP